MTLRERLNDSQLINKCWKHIYSSKLKAKRQSSKGPDKISIQDFKGKENIYLSELLLSLQKNTFRNHRLYGIAIKKQEKDKYRLIAVSNVKDRIVHKAILAVLNPILFEYIDTEVSYCGVKKNIWKKKDDRSLNTRKAFIKVTEHIKNKRFYVFKSDIKGFYDNVPKRRFLNIIKNLCKDILKDSSLYPLIRDITFFKLENPEEFTGPKAILLPKKYLGICQGSPLSQFFANIYLADFDQKMKKTYGDRFIRYIDDFIVFCYTKEEAKNAQQYATKLLKKKRA